MINIVQNHESYRTCEHKYVLVLAFISSFRENGGHFEFLRIKNSPQSCESCQRRIRDLQALTVPVIPKNLIVPTISGFTMGEIGAATGLISRSYHTIWGKLKFTVQHPVRKRLSSFKTKLKSEVFMYSLRVVCSRYLTVFEWQCERNMSVRKLSNCIKIIRIKNS